jgi:COMPASS component SWD2
VNYNPVEWSGMKFSADGKHILLSTTTNIIFLLDAFNGNHERTLSSFVNTSNSVMEASFSPDGQFILAGSEDGTIHIWETQSGREVSVWKGHSGPVGVVKWNPKTMMVASGCTNLAFCTCTCTLTISLTPVIQGYL